MTPLNSILQGDCTEIMAALPSASVDFVLTDPPYLVNYRNRDGQRILNDSDDAWLDPAFAAMHRLLKADSFAFSFYGWNRADRFMQAWRVAGFRVLGHFVFRKRYASATGYARSTHEQGFSCSARAIPRIRKRRSRM